MRVKTPISSSFFYRWRYVLATIFALLLMFGIMAVTSLVLPIGLHQIEIESLIKSNAIFSTILQPDAIVNLAYHVLQNLSMLLLGTDDFAVKLPSIIFGVLFIVGVYLLTKLWFDRTVSVIATLIAISLPLTIFLTQFGSPLIVAPALAIWLLLSATHVSREPKKRRLWIPIFLLLWVLNFYVPLGIYLNIALASTMIFHPYIRLMVRRYPSPYIVVAMIIAFFALTPLIYAVVRDPSVGLSLLGWPFATSLSAAVTYAADTIQVLIGNRAQIPVPYAAPIISITTLILMLIGLWQFISQKYTARSYVLWFWLIVLVPVTFLQPLYIAYWLPIIVLLISMGVYRLITVWYSMFPENPYARVVGLIPIAIIMVGMVSSGIAQFFAAYHYDPNLVQQFRQDTRLLDRALQATNHNDPEVTIPVIVSQDDLAFYKVIASHNSQIEVTTENPGRVPFIVQSRRYNASTNSTTGSLTRIVTNSHSRDAAYFYVYTSAAN